MLDLILEYGFTIIWSVLEFLGCAIFFHAFFPCRVDNKQKTISFFTVSTIMCIYSYFVLANFPRFILTVCFATGWSIFAFKGRWAHHLLVVILFYFFSSIVDIAVSFGTCALLGITFNDLVWRKLTYVLVVTMAKLVTVLIAHIVFRIHEPVSWQPMRSKWLLFTVLFPVVSMVMILLAFESNQGRDDITTGVFFTCCVLAIANVAILYLISMIERSTKNEMEIIMLNQQMDLQEKNIISLEKSYRVQRQATHDYRNQLQTIYDLVATNQAELVKSYIQELQETQASHMFSVNTRHPIIDAILNQKYQVAVENAIEMNFQITDLSKIGLETNVLVVLLSNLLDNAIEACQKLPDKRAIHCSILAKEDVFLSIKNTSKPVLINNNQIETTKVPKMDHGYGLVTVQRILQSLNAEYTFDYIDGWFQFVAEIPNGKK